MICKNCGAEIDDHVIECPFCGCENLSEAEKQHEGEVEHLHEMTEEMKTLKDRTARKAVKKSTKIIWIMIAAFFILALGIHVVTAIKAKTAVARQEKQLARLESYYNAGEYEKMGDYLDKCSDSYYTAYEKYQRVSSAYSNMTFQLDWLKQEYDNVVQYDTLDHLAGCYKYALEDLKKLTGYEEEGFIYEEGEAISDFEKQYMDVMETDGLLTDEEIRDALTLVDGDETDSDFLGVATLSRDRLKKK